MAKPKGTVILGYGSGITEVNNGEAKDTEELKRGLQRTDCNVVRGEVRLGLLNKDT
jgi:hypothetical protein